MELKVCINIVVFITKNNKNIESLDKKITNKDVYINDNPFKEEIGKIYNYFE